MATERILVNAKVADKFRETLSGTIDQVFPDKNGLVLIDKTPVEKNARLLKDAVSKGARALYGDISDKRELATAMRPIVLTGVKEDMDLYYTESFGPTVSLFVVGKRRRGHQNRQRYRIRSSKCSVHGEFTARFQDC